MPPAPPPAPLDGIKVLELGELVAGPFIGTLLGEFGAEVIKIERPGAGDLMRSFGPSVKGHSLYWSAHGRNKRSVVLDLKTPEGVAVLKDLMGHCQVIVNSLRPGTLEKLGIDEDWIRQACPEAILVYASAFGRSGPYAPRGGYDPVAQGFSGLSFLTGDADGAPMRAGGSVPVCDFTTGLIGALGAVMGLLHRANTGDSAGQTVDVALYDVAFRMTAPLLGFYDLSGQAAGRNGNHSLGGAPTGHFQTSDGHWVCVAVQNNAQFTVLAKLMGRADWLDRPDYAESGGRTADRDTICEAFAQWARQRTRGELIGEFDEVGLVAGAINAVTDLAADAHLEQRGYHWIEDPDLGRYRSPDVIPRLSGTPGSVRRPAPALGADTMDVLQSVLSYSSAHCEALRDAGVLGDLDARDPGEKAQ